jgi:hypothetical protein
MSPASGPVFTFRRRAVRTILPLTLITEISASQPVIARDRRADDTIVHLPLQQEFVRQTGKQGWPVLRGDATGEHDSRIMQGYAGTGLWLTERIGHRRTARLLAKPGLIDKSSDCGARETEHFGLSVRGNRRYLLSQRLDGLCSCEGFSFSSC